MVRSMTGYGFGECTMFNRKISVEIKSVNYRYNDISIKLPRILNSYDDEIKKFLSRTISRGKTDVYINLDSFSSNDIKISVNEALSDAYFNALSSIKSKYGMPDGVTLSILTAFPDIITVERNACDEKSLDEITQTLMIALKMATARFLEMREREGEALKKDLLLKNGILMELVGKIQLKAPLLLEMYTQKLLTKMNELLSNPGIDQTRILMEAALFADKSCIDEELTRLGSHISQFSQILGEGGTIGKKLDFLVQEIIREINTIGSKSNDIEITKYVVGLKSETEKIREQVQNIE